MGIYHRLPRARRRTGGGSPPGHPLRVVRWRQLLLAMLAALVTVGFAVPANATPITSPGGGESFNIHPGDSFKVGYDFTIPGNNQSVTVKWTNVKAVVNFTCPNGSAGSFTINMPDYTVTVSDSKWYPSGDQHSPLVYQGAVTAPDACGNGGVMHQNKIATFTADVTSSPSGIKLNYRFHDVDNNASGSWSSTNSVITSSIYQTIQGEIYLCSYGSPTTTLAPGGSITVPAAGLSSANPLPATQVNADTYTMNAAAPSGYSFVACGQSGVNIPTPDSANQQVTVPPGGAGDGKFYVTQNVSPTQTIQGEIFLCSNGSPTATLVSGGTIAVPAAGLSSPNPLPATQVAAGTYTMNASAPSTYQFVACGQSGVNIPTPDSANQQVTVPPGGAGDGKFYVTKIKQYIKAEIYLCSQYGTPTTILLQNAGTITVPAAGLSSGNPLPATSVNAGTYTVNASVPADFYEFVACGQSGVNIPTPSTANQQVTVPPGGTGDGKFYVTSTKK